jgi:predicted exporter
MLRAHDDVRSMATRPPQLLEQETRIRAITGLQTSSEFFLVEGDTAEAVLQREEALAERLRGLVERRIITHFQGVSAFVPSRQRQAENRRLVERRLLGDAKALQRTLDAVGFPPGTAEQLIDAYRGSENRWLDPESWLASPAAGAFRHLWLGKTDRGYAAIVMPAGQRTGEPLQDAAAGLPGVSFVDKVGSVSRLLHDYRVAFGYGLILAGVLALLILGRRYRARDCIAIVQPALLGVGVALAVLGYAGVPVTLFSVLALLLVIGVGSNYAIFLVEGHRRQGGAFIAVLLCSATTLLSFGLLAFSSTPALAGFGLTLLIGIGAAVMLAPLALTAVPKAAGAGGTGVPTA